MDHFFGGLGVEAIDLTTLARLFCLRRATPNLLSFTTSVLELKGDGLDFPHLHLTVYWPYKVHPWVARRTVWRDTFVKKTS